MALTSRGVGPSGRVGGRESAVACRRCCSRDTTIAKSSSRPSSSSNLDGVLIETFNYNSEDGPKQKATIEHVFSHLQPAVDAEQVESTTSSADDAQPWAVGWQMAERNLVWNDALKLRLIKRIASDQLGISEEEMEWRIAQLITVLPGLEERLAGAPPALVARLAAHTNDVADRMLSLKTTFPMADISAMVNNRLTLLLDDDLESIQEAAKKLTAMLPEINVDRFVEAFPLVLDYDSFEMAVEDAKRIMPDMELPTLLRTNPGLIMSLVKGKNLIPYDEFSNPWS